MSDQSEVETLRSMLQDAYLRIANLQRGQRPRYVLWNHKHGFWCGRGDSFTSVADEAIKFSLESAEEIASQSDMSVVVRVEDVADGGPVAGTAPVFVGPRYAGPAWTR